MISNYAREKKRNYFHIPYYSEKSVAVKLLKTMSNSIL